MKTTDHVDMFKSIPDVQQVMNKWIEEGVNEDTCMGTCARATLQMQEAFPFLERVRGHYTCAAWGQREHWWLKDPDGNIIDPTKSQFPSKGCGTYLEWDESMEEPTGMCPNCGEHAYGGATCCSSACHNSYAAYCMNPD